jgi:hypothetical protein
VAGVRGVIPSFIRTQSNIYSGGLSAVAGAALESHHEEAAERGVAVRRPESCFNMETGNGPQLRSPKPKTERL